ncbi:hydroxyethylthiazole kinase [Arthrobacter mobilis]
MAIRYTPEDCARLLEAVRTRQPLIQCLTNAVVTNFTANVLLAVGAAPAMVDIPGEAAEFAPVASGVLVNLGTPAASQRTAMLEAAGAARAAGTPWVLDPVAVGALSVRTAAAQELAGMGPAIIRGNASEILALAGSGAGGRGVDATDSPAAAAGAARQLAGDTGAAVAVSGARDLVFGPGGLRTCLGIDNGDVLLTRVTGGGCALGAVMAAFSAVTSDAVLAAAAATGTYTVAAERAARLASGPGSFAPAFLDELASVTPADIAASLRLAALDPDGLEQAPQPEAAR